MRWPSGLPYNDETLRLMARRLIPYAVATVFAVAALAVRAALTPWLGTLQPFAVGFVAVAASVLFCGWRPAVAAATICYVGGTYLFVQPAPPVYWTRPRDIAALITYASSAGLIIFMGNRARLAEQKLADANAQLRETDQRKDAFLAALSHELRNPVGVITTAVGVLERTATDSLERHTLSILSRQAAMVRRLVDDLLDVGRITRGRLHLRVAIVDLRTSVMDAVDANRFATDRKHQRLDVDLPDAPVEAPIDHARIVQVVSNLVDNASKYSPDDAAVRVSLRANATDATIEVLDTGPGISPRALPGIFDIFDLGDTSESGGLGLGLGLCKRLVELHHGTISVSTGPDGHGACFRVVLPRSQPPATRVPS